MSCVKINYALKDDKIVSILDIPLEERGLKCNCTCPVCHEKLSAKLGAKNQHHFAHAPNSNCDPNYATQTALHLLAKEIIEEEKAMKFPPYFIDFSETNIYKTLSFEDTICFKQKFTEPYEIIESKKVIFDSVFLENKLSSITPDIIGTVNNKHCLIEIAVTHFVDEEKEAKVRDLNLPMIEINLSNCIKNPLSIQDLKNKIIFDIDCKKWIFNPRIPFEIHKADEYYKSKIEEIKAIEKEEFESQCKVYSEAIISKRDNFSIVKLYDNLYFDKDSPFYKKYQVPPFFLDIPIEGENIIHCDRRKWQLFVFMNAIANDSIDFKILENLFVHNINVTFSPPNTYPNLRMVLKKFLFHLHYLCLIEYHCDGIFDPNSYILKNSSSFVAPTNSYAKKLKNIIESSDPCSLETAKKVDTLLSKQHFKR
ncbi:MAG: hypothetical protein E7602_08335 [Ruminococcaceae bacterium]|nr:hypothetical protein [Oscillospiraceae bacterium]